MRFQPELSTYSHSPQRKKKYQKERNDYDYSFSLLNPEGTIHGLLKGDILTSYEHLKIFLNVFLPPPRPSADFPGFSIGPKFQFHKKLFCQHPSEYRTTALGLLGAHVPTLGPGRPAAFSYFSLGHPSLFDFFPVPRPSAPADRSKLPLKLLHHSHVTVGPRSPDGLPQVPLF
jgi:hypothetical protein